MPELPEVEVVKRSLENKIKNLIIKSVKINDSKLRYKIDKKKLVLLSGLRFKRIKRRSKFLLFFFNKSFVMLVHLGMTGKLFYINENKKKFKTSFYYNLSKDNDNIYDRVIFNLSNKKKLIYNDVRKFGFIKILKQDYNDNFHLAKLGPEPLSKQYNLRYFKKKIKNKKCSIKSLLMNQKFVSGLGNIYVNEILFLSGIKPMKKINSLTVIEIKKIIKFSKIILRKAIKQGGSTIKDFSNDTGKKGIFQQSFKVYGKKGERCSNIDCSQRIYRVIISQRSAFYCPRCQK